MEKKSHFHQTSAPKSILGNVTRQKTGRGGGKEKKSKSINPCSEQIIGKLVENIWGQTDSGKKKCRQRAQKRKKERLDQVAFPDYRGGKIPP